MIGKLSGIIDSFAQDHLILDVSGVGYVVYASSKTLSRIGQAGDAVSLLIDTIVREDAFLLYGFADAAEQQWFRLLTTVQGVGAKAALSILTVCPAEQLGFIIAAQDKAGIQRADGVGPKLAARIVTELKDKAAGLELSPKMGGKAVDNSVEPKGASRVDQDAVSALVNLGYARAEAYQAVLKVQGEANDNDLQSLIRAALQELSA